MDEMITIPMTQFVYLQDRNEFLNALENCGVDNWEGYSAAWRIIEEEGGENIDAA